MSALSVQIAVGEVLLPHVSPTAPSAADGTPSLSAGVAAPGERQEPLPGAGLPRPAALEVLAADVEPGDRIIDRGVERPVLSAWARAGVATIELGGRYTTRWTIAADRLIGVAR